METELDYRDAPIASTKSIQTPYGEQDENGTDLSLIRWVFSLSPAQRLLAGDDARREVLYLQAHARRMPKELRGGTR